MYIVINTPHILRPAGVSSHYLGLRPFFSRKVRYNQYYTLGIIRERFPCPFFHIPLRIITFIFDLGKFSYQIIRYHSPLILLNPSFKASALKRDVVFLYIAKILGCRVAVFFHGWDNHYAEKVLSKKQKFSIHWKKADCFFVLAREFKSLLESFGIMAPIYLTTTKVNEQLLEGISVDKPKSQIQRLLFLARIEREKGIFITIDAYRLLKRKYPFLELRIIGSGSALAEARQYVTKNKIADVIFTGPLPVDKVKIEYLQSDLYLLPTTHGEGMPTSVLEAMALGLPVLTSPIGGIRDFFQNGVMGYTIDDVTPEAYAKYIEQLIHNPTEVQNISKFNKQYAKTHFMASVVAKSLEARLRSLSKI